jgi:hypothetical protein
MYYAEKQKNIIIIYKENQVEEGEKENQKKTWLRDVIEELKEMGIRTWEKKGAG